jgi:DNA repair exonuclease SbcCD nuclease subunit
MKKFGKIGIIGDIHIGQASNMGKQDPETQLNTRLLDFIGTFNSIIDAHIKVGVKTLVLVGDCLDSRNPSPVAMKSFAKCLRRAIDKGIKKILINIGNHDQQRQISATSLDIFNELKIPNIQVFTTISSYSISPNFHLVFLPYCDRRMLGAKDKEEAIKILKTRINIEAKKLKGTKLLIGHLMLEKESDELNGEKYGLNELVLPLNMFDAFNAVIMGHVHKHSILQKKPLIINSGSMDKISFGERDHQKVSIVLSQNLNYSILPTITRNLIEIKLDYSDLLYKKEINTKILADIKKIDKKTPLKDAIIKVLIRVKENDSYFVSQSKIRNLIMSMDIQHCASIYINAINTRQLRDETINEVTSTKDAMVAFINNLAESKNMKGKLIKLSNKIINEINNQ